jgi:hypothetical protein
LKAGATAIFHLKSGLDQLLDFMREKGILIADASISADLSTGAY